MTKPPCAANENAAASMSWGEPLDRMLRQLVREAVTQAIETGLVPELVALREAVLQARSPAALPQFLTADEAGRIAGVVGETVRSWVRRGELGAYRAGRGLRIRLDELEAYLGRRREAERAEASLDEARVAEILADVAA